jgi:hypothetical protein
LKVNAPDLQVEYYFSDENLPTDEFMLKFVKKNKEGFGKYCVIASGHTCSENNSFGHTCC